MDPIVIILIIGVAIFAGTFIFLHSLGKTVENNNQTKKVEEANIQAIKESLREQSNVLTELAQSNEKIILFHAVMLESNNKIAGTVFDNIFIKDEYRFNKECSSKKEFDSFEPIDLLDRIINEQKEDLERLENRIEINIKSISPNYDKKISELRSRLNNGESNVQPEYRELEKEVFNELILPIPTSYKFIIEVEYTSKKTYETFIKQAEYNRSQIISRRIYLSNKKLLDNAMKYQK